MADFVEMKNAVARATEDDIVNQLRHLQHRGLHPEDYRYVLIGQAADEIERLRNQVERWIEVALRFNHADNQHSLQLFEEAKQLFKEAMKKDMSEQ